MDCSCFHLDILVLNVILVLIVYLVAKKNT
jgi:hypothetical protein